MRMRKKILAMLFAIGLLFTMLPTVAQAEESGWCGMDVQWTLSEGVLTITGTGDMSITGSNPWGKYYDSIETINIASGVTSIEESAFSGCSRLKNVTLPEGMVKIGRAAFTGCSGLTSLEIPNSVTDIGWGAFQMCENLESIVIPQGVTNIESCVFTGCRALRSVTLPESVSSIGSSAFSGCNNLVDIDIPEGVTSIGNSAFNECYLLSSIVIPKGVTKIEEKTFTACKKLENIEIPDSITSIGRDAFLECHSLKSFTIPEGVTKIEYRTFFGCVGLENIRIPDSVTSIGEAAFGNCSKITNIEIPSNVTSIGNSAFSACPITSIVIPEGITSIGEGTFSGCGRLKSVTLPASIIEIGENAFLYCQCICDVYFTGTEKQRELISIKNGNDNLTEIVWQYIHLHTEVIDPAMEPTYFDTGLTEGSHCSNCGETIKEQQTVPKKVLGVPVLTVTGGTDSVKLVWKQIDGATGYEIFRSTSHEGSYSKIQTVSGGSILSFADTGLSAETTYYYKIRTVATANGKTVYSSDSTILPVKTETKNQESEVTPPANPKPETYTIKTSTGKGGKANGGGTKKVGEQVTLTAIPDKGYYFAGWKENNKKVSSSQTYTFSVKKNQELTASFAKFSAPVLSKTSVDITSVKVSWKKVPGATAYEVYRANSKSGKFTKKAVISKSSTVNYTDKKLTTGKTYYYKVRAVASGTVKTTYSNYSSMKSAKPLPAKIGGVKASAGSKSVKMSWKKAAGVTGYEVYRSTSKNGKYKKVKSISKAATTKYTDKKLKAKKTYYYKVRAYKKVSGKKVYGAFSAVKSAKTKK
ncbi:MAG: leucine-rich repeat protein [Dorea sp.]|jgi:fibronectin type 3 domain-containing protein|nr:leucine-rich repeat protein [Dorea sp.]